MRYHCALGSRLDSLLTPISASVDTQLQGGPTAQQQTPGVTVMVGPLWSPPLSFSPHRRDCEPFQQCTHHKRLRRDGDDRRHMRRRGSVARKGLRTAVRRAETVV
jgi:hypothetical protein